MILFTRSLDSVNTLIGVSCGILMPTTAVREQVERLSQKIAEALNEPWTPPEEGWGIKEAKAPQQADELELASMVNWSTNEEQIQAEAKARRRAERLRKRPKTEVKRLVGEEDSQEQAEAEKKLSELPDSVNPRQAYSVSIAPRRWGGEAVAYAALVAAALFVLFIYIWMRLPQ